MEDLVSRIIEIEHDAQEYLKTAEEKSNCVENQIEQKTKALQQDISERVRARCDIVKQTKDSEAHKRIEKLEEKTERQIAYLENQFAEKSDEWVNMVFEEIIK